MLRKFEEHEDEVLRTAKRIRQRRVTGRRMKMLLSAARAKVVAMQGLLARCSSDKRVIRSLGSRLHGCQSMLGKAKQGGEVSPLVSLPAHRRALLEDFLEALRSCITSRKNADALVERVIRRLV